MLEAAILILLVGVVVVASTSSPKQEPEKLYVPVRNKRR